MGKKITVDREVTAHLPLPPASDGTQQRTKHEGGAVETIEKGKSDRKPESPSTLETWLAEIPKVKVYALEVIAELKKVQWPTRKQVRAEVITVLATVALVTAFVYGLDRIFTVLSNMLFK